MNNVEVFDFSQHDNMGAYIHEITSGGARVVIDCVGMDGKKSPAEAVQQKLKLQGGTLSAIDIAKDAVSKFGTIQLTGVYGLTYNMFPLGNMFERNVTLKMGQAPVIHLMPMLYEKIENGEFDPREIISHIMPLEKASEAYQIFNDHTDDCTKVVLKP
jgi:S-(hydroxymethyl)glutathione dehydrogenase/alcohol dehydrogenase